MRFGGRLGKKCALVALVLDQMYGKLWAEKAELSMRSVKKLDIPAVKRMSSLFS